MPAEKKKFDRRAGRTRRSLSDALVALILEKRYDEITVQNVLDRADVGRSTFYSHYRDKDDLFLSGWEALMHGVARGTRWENLRAGRFVPVRELFQHVQDFQHFYKALVRSRKTGMLFKSGPIYLSKAFEESLASRLRGKRVPSVPVSVLSNYLAGGMLTLMKWWLDQGMPYTPERMDEMFHALVMPGFRTALEGVEVDTK